MVPHLLRVLPVVEEHGAVRIHPGNPVAAGQILCEIVRAILLYPMGDVLCQTLQLTGDPILEITVEHAHDQHQAGQQHCQGHAQDGAKDPFRHVSPALLSVHRADLVAIAPDRLDVNARLSQLLAEGPHVDVHGPALAGKGVAPDVLDQLLPGKHLAGVAQQQAQHFKLLLGQDGLLSPDPDDVLPRIHLQNAAAEGAVLRLRPPQQRPDAGEQLHHAEGLGHIVIGAAVQTHHLVVLRALGRQHDDRQLGRAGRGPELFQDAESILLRQHDIQQHQGRHLLSHGLPEQGGQRKAPGLHTLAVQCIDHKIPDTVVILQQIDHRYPSPFNLSAPLEGRRVSPSGGRSDQLLLVNHQLELQAQLLRCLSTEEHPAHEDLKIVHDRAVLRVHGQLQLDE
ncbi:DNA-processing protein DprA, partial [Dysosmobacter welbionis]